jgi:hypothetical protein
MTVSVLAVWRGKDEERLATGALLANWALDMVVFREGSHETQWEQLGFDSALLVLYVWLALRTRRFWPLFVAGFQLLIVITHFGRTVDPSISSWAYLTAEIIWSYLILFTLAYAAWTAPRYAQIAEPPDDTPVDPAEGATRR